MVRNLLLIRHAEANFNSESGRDFDRRLSEFGVKQSIMLGQYLTDQAVSISAIYTSPSLRTLETVKHFTEPMEHKPRLMDAEELYEPTMNVLKAVVSRFSKDFDHVALVSHNPAITGLFTYLTSEIRDFSPGTCAWLTIKADDWSEVSGGSCEVKDFYYPGMVE